MLIDLIYGFLWKFVKFCVVGTSGLIIDFGITYLCKEIFKIQKYVANAIGFTISATTNYFLNRVWTFNSNNPEVAIEFSKFFIISIIGLGINTFIIWLLTSKFRINFYISKGVATLIVVLWNFFANLLITFAN